MRQKIIRWPERSICITVILPAAILLFRMMTVCLWLRCGGGSGLTSAITAAAEGASVIVIEKNGALGGDTVVCGAVCNSYDREGQSKLTMDENYVTTLETALAEEPVSDEHAALIEQVKADWEAFQADGSEGIFDSAAWYALQTWNGGDKIGDLALIEKYTENSWPGCEWLYSIGMEFQDQMGQTAGSLWKRSHFSKMNMGTGFISSYMTTLAGMDNVKLYPDLDAQHLLTDENGKVVGVEALNAAGETETFTAKMGVILATGGYSANGEMVQENNTSGKWGDLSGLPTTNRSTCSQGDGIVMATEIGAGVRDLDKLQLLYLGNMVDGGLSKYPARCNTATTETIFVNKEGKRFVREDGRRDEICAAVLAQTDQSYYIIESADGPTYEDITSPDWRSADGFTREYLEENGYIWVADTIEELAEKIGVPADELKNSVDSYNACYDADEDPEFGRTAFAARLDHAPFYATIRQASIHYTMGGLTIDTDGHVLSENGDVIDGLYACGVHLQIKYNTMRSIGKQTRIPYPTASAPDLKNTALSLLDLLWHEGDTPIRTITVTAIYPVENGDYVPTSLFEEEVQSEKRTRLERSIDDIRARFGFDAITRGSLLKNGENADFDEKAKPFKKQ